MPLQTSGAISLNEIHVEAGGSSGTQASINDSDIRALINKASGATSSFSNFYGASASYSATITIGTYTSPSSQYVASTFSTGYHNTAYGNPANSYGSITTDDASFFQAGAKIADIVNNQSFRSLALMIDDNADLLKLDFFRLVDLHLYFVGPFKCRFKTYLYIIKEN